MTARPVLDPLVQERHAAQLALVAGHGRRGAAVAAAAGVLLRAAPEPLRRSLGHCEGSDTTAIDAAIDRLRGIENLERLEMLGYRVSALRVGERLPLAVFVVIDMDDPDAAAEIPGALERIAVTGVAALPVAVPIAQRLDGEALRRLAQDDRYRCVLPFTLDGPSGLAYAEADLIGMAARALVVLSTPGQLDALLRGGQERIVRVAAAFVEADVDQLSERLAARVATRLIIAQLARPTPHRGPFDEQQATSAPARVAPGMLAARLIERLPFRLDGASNGPWRLHLAEGEIAFSLHGVPPVRWVAVLHTLREFLRFTKARRWREQLESAREAVGTDLVELIESDLAILHRQPRGADRVLAWAERMRAVLEEPFEITRPAAEDFDAAVGRLGGELQRSTPSLALWARVTVLGAFAAAVASRVGAVIADVIGAGVAALLTAAVALGCGLWLQHRSEARVLHARRRAVAALADAQETQVRENLLVTLSALRERLLGVVDTIQAAHVTLGLNLPALVPLPPDLREEFHVSQVVPGGLEDAFLAHLGLDWDALQRAAASAGALVPPGRLSETGLEPPQATTMAFATQWLSERRRRLGVVAQVAFRSAHAPGFREETVEMLQRRSALSAGGRITETVWLGPADLLASVLPGAVAGRREAMEIELLGCLRLAREPLPVREPTQGET